jgi:hypothetical protein
MDHPSCAMCITAFDFEEEQQPLQSLIIMQQLTLQQPRLHPVHVFLCLLVAGVVRGCACHSCDAANPAGCLPDDHQHRQPTARQSQAQLAWPLPRPMLKLLYSRPWCCSGCCCVANGNCKTASRDITGWLGLTEIAEVTSPAACAVLAKNLSRLFMLPAYPAQYKRHVLECRSHSFLLERNPNAHAESASQSSEVQM